jgi:D-aminopeptidase
VAFGWKGGIGTASRKLPASLGGYTVGALVQSNFDGILMMDGVRLGERLGRHRFRDALGKPPVADDGGGGSCMIVIATDAPLSSRNLSRLASRAILALGRVGSFMANGSGDFVIAFSTANIETQEGNAPTRTVVVLRDERLDPIFLAGVESVEEAIYNSLLRARSLTGFRNRTVEALPIERFRKILDERERRAVAPQP